MVALSTVLDVLSLGLQFLFSFLSILEEFFFSFFFGFNLMYV